MYVSLKRGTCAALLADQPIPNRFVQVLTIRDENDLGFGCEQYMLEISDGFASIPVMLTTNLNDLISKRKLAPLSIIKISEHVHRKVSGIRMVIISAISFIGSAGAIRSKPVPLDVVEDPDDVLSAAIACMERSKLLQVPESKEPIGGPLTPSLECSSQTSSELASTESSALAPEDGTLLAQSDVMTADGVGVQINVLADEDAHVEAASMAEMSHTWRK
ncbi:hypothetical protein DACRYDRAFT_117347 [Dacryopinax primogenitus]|uniref:Replication factor-A protein 1 N-terminal domain-containing protein n=1 Tax=Dacryopinax primogenitus (strain DJM 731) TaxID=1858805 RepID=M5FX68_DACPD|nr:uncharacterized protein DACRYDRAFT_117347 [Dacryopinax primogenitus]EJU00340.1 hypothetical protein DACRYDRAFT_117347 [Dacryopinax primogenitus]